MRAQTKDAVREIGADDGFHVGADEVTEAPAPLRLVGTVGQTPYLLGQDLRAPYRKPHLMPASRTIIFANMSFGLVRQRFRVDGVHFFSAMAQRRLAEIDQPFVSRHGEHRGPSRSFSLLQRTRSRFVRD